MNPTAADELTGTLRDVVAGRIDIDARLRSRDRPARGGAAIRPVIHFENHRSQRFTVLEILARNAWGLLYRVSRAISNQGCDIDLVLIATEGTRAVDVFHVTQAGRKLTGEQQDELRAELETTLAAGQTP